MSRLVNRLQFNAVTTFQTLHVMQCCTNILPIHNNTLFLQIIYFIFVIIPKLVPKSLRFYVLIPEAS